MLHRVQPTQCHAPTPPPSGKHPDDEAHRLSILRHYEILDTPPEAAFERITALAANLFHVPVSIIGFLDCDRLWFKSHRGLAATEVGRDRGETSMLKALVVEDGALGFFTSVPLRTSDGYDMGALCVIDRAPHEIDETLIRNLKALADIVMDQLELRLSTRRDSIRPSHQTGSTDMKTRFADLTTRQREILELVVAGRPSKIIAADLGISQRTVENHRAAIMKRTGAKSIPALARFALLVAGLGASELLALTSLAGAAV